MAGVSEYDAVTNTQPYYEDLKGKQMPEFTESDRRVIESEGSAWALLDGVRHMKDQLTDTGFHLASVAIEEALHQLAVDLRAYNDQFEVEE